MDARCSTVADLAHGEQRGSPCGAIIAHEISKNETASIIAFFHPNGFSCSTVSTLLQGPSRVSLKILLREKSPLRKLS